MSRRLRTPIASSITLLASAVVLLSGHVRTASVTVDGVVLEGRVDRGHVLIENYAIQNNRLEVAAVPGRQVDVTFEPVALNIGETFEATGLDAAGQELATIRLDQTGETTTDVYVSLAPVLDRLNGATVSLRARAMDGAVTEVAVDAESELKIGQVTAPTSAWAKTYHVVCMEGECTLAVDPDETEVEFDAAPGRSVPFQYLEVGFSLK